MNAKQQNICEHFIGLSVLLAFILPHASTPTLIVNPLLCILLKFTCGGKVSVGVKWGVAITLIITAVLMLTDNLTAKAMSRLLVLVIYFLCFPIVGSYRVRNGYLYLCLMLIFISQISYIYHISYITNLIDKYYPISEMWSNSMNYMRANISVDTFSDYRLGGLYRNANQCAKYITVLLAFFLTVNFSQEIKRVLPYIIISFMGVLMTGSRTGFVVLFCIILIFLFRRKDVNKFVKWTLLLAGLVALLVIFINGSDQYRGLNIQQGFANSLAAKNEVLLDYLSHEKSAVRLLFGYMDASLYNASNWTIMSNFDAELGNLVFCYGFVGVLAITIFLVSIYKQTKGKLLLFYAVLLWMVSSTVFSAYRTSFIFLLLSSSLYSSSIEGNKQLYYK